MGLFSSGEDKHADQQALEAVLASIDAMPLPELAEQVLVRCWGHGGPGDAYVKEPREMGLNADAVQAVFSGNQYAASVEQGRATAIADVVEEAVQLLEHAGLVVLRVGGGDIVNARFRPTRAGLKAIDAGDVRARLEA